MFGTPGDDAGGSQVRPTTNPEPITWTAEAVRNLGMTTDVETAGSILGIGRTKAYEMAKNGEFPVMALSEIPHFC
jgi:hypothetical protein